MAAEAASAATAIGAPEIEIASQGIDVITKVIDLYDKVMDKVIPWKQYEETVAKLDAYKDHYSTEAADLVGGIITLIKNAQDAYFVATQHVYEWCQTMIPLLRLYLKVLDSAKESDINGRRTILLKCFESGITKMTAAQESLNTSSSSFNDASGKMVKLTVQLKNDFDRSSSYFQNQVDKIRKDAYLGAASGAVFGPFGLVIAYSIAAGIVEGKLIPELENQLAGVKSFTDNLNGTLDSTKTQIEETKQKLTAEVRIIGDLKSQTETTKDLVELDFMDAAKQELKIEGEKLITLANGYIAAHKS